MITFGQKIVARFHRWRVAVTFISDNDREEVMVAERKGGERMRKRWRSEGLTRYVINFRNPATVCYGYCVPNHDFGIIIYVPSPLCPSGARYLNTVRGRHRSSSHIRDLEWAYIVWLSCDNRICARARDHGRYRFRNFHRCLCRYRNTVSDCRERERDGRGGDRSWTEDRMEQEEGCWRMSGYRVSWPGGADGHETNVIGEPSRLLFVARSSPFTAA